MATHQSKENRWTKVYIFGLMFFAVACGKQEYSQCEKPNEQLKILFKSKSNTNPFSHSFCIVCNPEIEPSEYTDWAISMGAPQGPVSVEDVHPCLYAYLPTNSPFSEIDSLELCESLICNEEATYSDMVGQSNGNIDVTPLLD